jgi:hypothetical protein
VAPSPKVRVLSFFLTHGWLFEIEGVEMHSYKNTSTIQNASRLNGHDSAV